MRRIILTLACKGLMISDRCHVRFATLVKKNVVSVMRKVHMNQLENCQARYRSNTWMGRTRTDGPDEFEPSKFDCTLSRNMRFPNNVVSATSKASDHPAHTRSLIRAFASRLNIK